MRIVKFKDVEYSEVLYNELYGEMRIDSEYYEPQYIRNAEVIERKECKAIKDFMHTPQYGLSIAMNEDAVGYKILKMDDIVGVIANDDYAKYADIPEMLFKNFRLDKFDVLFNRVNSDEFVGRTGIYLLSDEHTFASYLIRLSSDLTFQNFYLTIFLNCKYGYNSLQRVKRRAVNQANINAQELKTLRIPLPSPKFQKEIERLVLESNQHKIKSKEQYAKAESDFLKEIGLDNWKPEELQFTIQDHEFTVEDTIFEGGLKDTFTFNRIDSEYYQPKFDYVYNVLKTLHRAGSITLERLGDVVTYKKGIEVGSSEYINEPEVPFMRVSNFNKLGINFGTCKYISTETYEFLKANFEPQVGEILFSKDGTAGLAYLIREEMATITSGGILRLKYRDDRQDFIETDYIELVLNSLIVQLQVEQQTSGALIQHLKITDAMKMMFPIVKNHSALASEVKLSFNSRIRSRILLEIAVQATEIFIEKDEKSALNFIRNSEG